MLYCKLKVHDDTVRVHELYVFVTQNDLPRLLRWRSKPSLHRVRSHHGVAVTIEQTFRLLLLPRSRVFPPV